MTTIRAWPLKVLVATTLMSASLQARAEGGGVEQFHFRVGADVGKYSGPESASFMVPTSTEFEIELFSHVDRSDFIRGVFAMDYTKAKVFNSGIAYGQRFYIGAPGMMWDRIDDGFKIKTIPMLRYYIGWDLGVSQVLIRELTASYSVVGSVAEVGGAGGAIYQITDNIGIDLNLAASFGFGFTTVAVNGQSIRFTVGMTSFF